MNLKEAILSRHSVRAYQEKPLTAEDIHKLEALIGSYNQESGLHIQLITNEPKAFDSRMAHYGKFSGVSSYIAMIGPKGGDLDEKCGYWGERLVLEAQCMGLNTCWVALTYKKIPSVFRIGPGEKLCIVIAIGYGVTSGTAHKSKPDTAVGGGADHPNWFREGIRAALLAPTAVNQQKFRFSREGNTVTASAGLGICSRIDLGIVKCHFEIGAGADNFRWK